MKWLAFFCGEESALDEIIMDGSDDDLGFDDEIEINEDDDGKVAKMEIMINKTWVLLAFYNYSSRWPALHQPWTCRRRTKRTTV